MNDEMKPLSAVYFLPCKPGSVYVNLADKCLNNCLFCIKRNGPVFFGINLSLDKGVPKVSRIMECMGTLRNWEGVKEVVVCGMGEPLLRYDDVTALCQSIRKAKGGATSIRVDTSGLTWAHEKRLDLLEWIDVLSVSLNGENAEKYEELCRPQIEGAYEVLMDFLGAVKNLETEKTMVGKPFPRVRLSVVDTSEETFIPESGRVGYAPGSFPVPDFDACRAIAAAFGWPLIVKRLFRDSCDEIWNDPAIREMCARGIELERCRACEYRH